MAEIKYGKSSAPRTARGRRRLKRKHLQDAFAESSKIISNPLPSRVQIQLARKAFIPPNISSARPLKDIANKAAISINEYRLNLERASLVYEAAFNRVEKEAPYKDAMSMVVNHAHQRSPKKKWS